MTLGRLNPVHPAPVIDRTDDSGERQTRVAVYGERHFFLEVLIEAIERCGFAASWADWPSDHVLLDADLVVLSLDVDGYSERVRRLIRVLAAAELIAVTIDAATPQPPGGSWTPAGAIWAIDPALMSVDELAGTITAAAEQRRAAAARRARDDRAAAIWDTARESSIPMMQHDRKPGEDGVETDGVASRADGDHAAAVGGGDGGRQR